MKKDRLEQELRNHFSAEVEEAEPSHGWWNSAISQVVTKRNRSRWLGLVPKTRLAWAFLPLVVLLLGGAVYGASSLLGELFQRHAPQLEEAGLAQELELNQTINGITVSLERAYADSNVVLVGFTVNGPDPRYQAEISGLSTADGQNLSGIIGVGTGSKEIMGNLNSSATIYTFDASTLKDVYSELNLILEVNVADLPMVGESKTLAGPFRFEFDVPFHAGKSIDICQTVEAEGVPVTLEQVTISHWGVSAVLRNPDGKEYAAIVSLTLPNRDQVNASLVRHTETSIVNYSRGDFTEQSGEWTLTVSELVLDSPDTPQQRLVGPWVFSFDVP
jgi:hypothetical protein